MPMKEVHIKRWELAVAFVSITVAFVIGLVVIKDLNDQNHRAIAKIDRLAISNEHAITRIDKILHDLNKTKASIHSLERTNCGLRQTLRAARKARIVAASHEKGAQRHADLTAVKSYNTLLKLFPPDNCRSILPPKANT